MAIIKRETKGSPLTHKELDDNFSQLASTGSKNIFTGTQEMSGSEYVDSASIGAGDLLVAMKVTGSIIPEGNGIHDIGSEDNPFRDLYVSPQSRIE